MIPLNQESASAPVRSDAFQSQPWVFCLILSLSLHANVNVVNWSRALDGFKMKCLYEIVLTSSLLQTALVQRFVPAQGKGECGEKKRQRGMLGLLHQWQCWTVQSESTCEIVTWGRACYLYPNAIQGQWCTDMSVRFTRPDLGICMQSCIKSLSEKELWTRLLQALLTAFKIISYSCIRSRSKRSSKLTLMILFIWMHEAGLSMYMILYNVRTALKQDFALSSNTTFQLQRGSASPQSTAEDETTNQLLNI